MRLIASVFVPLCIAALVSGCGCKSKKPADESENSTDTSKAASTLDLLPVDNAVAGWSLVEPVKRYVGKELDDPINGAADAWITKEIFARDFDRVRFVRLADEMSLGRLDYAARVPELAA